MYTSKQLFYFVRRNVVLTQETVRQSFPLDSWSKSIVAQMRELEELRAKAEELEKLKAKLKKRDQQIASLQEAISLKKLL